MDKHTILCLANVGLSLALIGKMLESLGVDNQTDLLSLHQELDELRENLAKAESHG